MKKGIDREEVVYLYVEEKLSTVQIGKKVGLTPGAIASILEVRGIKRRGPKESIAVRYPEGRFGSNSPRWKGGRRRASVGGKYIYVYCPDHLDATKAGYVMEHRLVAEKMIGRRLKKNEIPHHKNGIKNDNRSENLKVMTRSEHVQLHFDAIKEVYRLKSILDMHEIDY